MAIFHKNILKIRKFFLWAKMGGNLSSQWLLAGSKFGNFAKTRINENMFFMQGVNIFCHNEVYKGTKQPTKSVLTFVDGMISYILGAN